MTDNNKSDFPICQTGKKIPWSVAERAYEEYARRFGKSQTLERLAERGGFYVSEMNELYPGWREEVEEVYLLRKEVQRLNADLAAAVETAVTKAVFDHGQAWRDIADHLGGLCLGGVDVQSNQRQICEAIDARESAAYRRGQADRTREIWELMRHRVSYVACNEIKLAYPECFAEEAEKP